MENDFLFFIFTSKRCAIDEVSDIAEKKIKLQEENVAERELMRVNIAVILLMYCMLPTFT